MSTNRPAVQLYTLRREIAGNYAATLQAVAELGYRAVEIHTLGDYSARELRHELDLHGLSVAGIHVPLARLENDTGAVAEEAQQLQSRFLVCPWLPAELQTVEGYRRVAETLSRVGAALKGAGLRLCYHNHAFEFKDLGGTSGFDILFSESDPALVAAELDVYWAAYAGLDPVALLDQLGIRAALVHLKDMSPGPDRGFAEVGHGVLDMPAILAACDRAGTEWLIVEQDETGRPPLESVGMSLAYLRSVGRA